MSKLVTISISLATLAGVAYAGDPAGGAPAVPPKAADAKPPEMKPPQELTDMAKAMAGTWSCTGTAEMGGKNFDVKATITHKSDLDGWWIQRSFTGTAPTTPPSHFTGFTTYDAAKKMFYRTMVNGHGGHGVEWGTATDKKLAFEGDARWNGNDIKTRNTEEMTSPKEVHVVGEYSKDGGKTWNKDH